MKKIWVVIIFMFVCGLAVSGTAQAQSYDSESASESSMASSLSSEINSEQAEGAQNVQEMDTSMQGNETATQTY